ncbi:MAG: hypothetical protein ACHQEM_11845 [Chitinophagales bacterium]
MRNIAPHKIVGGFNRREGQAVAWVYKEYYSGIMGIVIKLLGEDSPDIEDLAGEVFLKVLKSTVRFDRL